MTCLKHWFYSPNFLIPLMFSPRDVMTLNFTPIIHFCPYIIYPNACRELMKDPLRWGTRGSYTLLILIWSLDLILKKVSKMKLSTIVIAILIIQPIFDTMTISSTMLLEIFARRSLFNMALEPHIVSCIRMIRSFSYRFFLLSKGGTFIYYWGLVHSRIWFSEWTRWVVD